MDYTILILALPMLSFLLLALAGMKMPHRVAGAIGTLSLGVVAVLSYLTAFSYFTAPRTAEGLYPTLTPWNIEWLPFTSSLHIDMGILLEPISVMMLVVISTVSLMVHIYSFGYMKGEVGFQRYYAFLSLFTFSMLGLVVATNIFQMYVFWELVGVSSYLLIGFYYTKPEAIAAAKQRLAGAVDYYKAVQFFFYTQWNALKAYANGKGVRLVGDIPIYVSPDSSDLWTHPELFQTDGQMHLTQVAGCPPDAFAADGQLWGNPLYDWPTHKATGFAWWKQRMKHATSIYDVVRIDHFRGFESYYSIPAGNKTAAGGHWEKGPDLDFINAMHENLGEGGIIAEDLGYLTPEVKAMLSASGYPGMKIMQFAFDSRESGNYLPHTYHRNSVVYTGTHDNVTAEGWRTNASAEDVAYACRYLRCQPEELTEAMICACLASVSDTAVIPLADWLHLGSEARINTPSTQGSNWQWRLACPLPEALAGHIAQLTVLYERAQ